MALPAGPRGPGLALGVGIWYWLNVRAILWLVGTGVACPRAGAPSGRIELARQGRGPAWREGKRQPPGGVPAQALTAKN